MHLYETQGEEIETEYRQSGQVVVSERARIRNGKLVCGGAQFLFEDEIVMEMGMMVTQHCGNTSHH